MAYPAVELRTVQYNKAIAYIKNATYTDVSALLNQVNLQMTRLSLTANPLKTVSGNQYPGEWEYDVGSLIEWMNDVTTDNHSRAQIIEIQATCVTRLAL